MQAMPERGWMAVSVPGAVAGWMALSKRYGKLPFADLLAPAIDTAERGFMVTPIIAGQWARAVADFLRSSRVTRSISCRMAARRCR